MPNAKTGKHRERLKGGTESPARLPSELASQRKKLVSRQKRKRVEIPELEAKGGGGAASQSEWKKLGEGEVNVDAVGKDGTMGASDPRALSRQHGTIKRAAESVPGDPPDPEEVSGVIPSEGKEDRAQREKVRDKSPVEGLREPDNEKQDVSRSGGTSWEPNRNRKRRNLLAGLGTVSADIANLTRPRTRGMARPFAESETPLVRKRKQRASKVVRVAGSEKILNADMPSTDSLMEGAQGQTCEPERTQAPAGGVPLQKASVLEAEKLMNLCHDEIVVDSPVEERVVSLPSGRVARGMKDMGLTYSRGDTFTPKSGADGILGDRIDEGGGQGEHARAVAPSARMKLRNRKEVGEAKTARERPRKRARNKEDQGFAGSKETVMEGWLPSRAVTVSGAAVVQASDTKTDRRDLTSASSGGSLQRRRNLNAGHECYSPPAAKEEASVAKRVFPGEILTEGSEGDDQSRSELEVDRGIRRLASAQLSQTDKKPEKKMRNEEAVISFAAIGAVDRKRRKVGLSESLKRRGIVDSPELREDFKSQLESESTRAHLDKGELDQKFHQDDAHIKAEADAAPLSVSGSLCDIRAHIGEQRSDRQFTAGEDFVATGTAEAVADRQVSASRGERMKSTAKIKEQDGDFELDVELQNHALDKPQIKKQVEKGKNVGRQSLGSKFSEVVEKSLKRGQNLAGSAHRPRLRSAGVDTEMRKALTASGIFWEISGDRQGTCDEETPEVATNLNFESLDVHSRSPERASQSAADKSPRRKIELAVEAKGIIDEPHFLGKAENGLAKTGQEEEYGPIAVCEGQRPSLKSLPALKDHMAGESRRVRATYAVPEAGVSRGVSENFPSAKVTGDIRQSEGESGSLTVSTNVVEMSQASLGRAELTPLLSKAARSEQAVFSTERRQVDRNLFGSKANHQIVTRGRDSAEKKMANVERKGPVNTLESERVYGDQTEAIDRHLTENGKGLLSLHGTSSAGENDNLSSRCATDSTIAFGVKNPNTRLQHLKQEGACIPGESPKEKAKSCQDEQRLRNVAGVADLATSITRAEIAKSRIEVGDLGKAPVALLLRKGKQKEVLRSRVFSRASHIEEVETRAQGNIGGQEHQRESGADRLESNQRENLHVPGLLSKHPDSPGGVFDLEEQIGVGSPENDMHVTQLEDDNSLGLEFLAVERGLRNKGLEEAQKKEVDDSAVGSGSAGTLREQSTTEASRRYEVQGDQHGRKSQKQSAEGLASEHPARAPVVPLHGDLSSSQMVSCTKLLQSLHSSIDALKISSGSVIHESGFEKHSFLRPLSTKLESQLQRRERITSHAFSLSTGLPWPTAYDRNAHHYRVSRAEGGMWQNVPRTKASNVYALPLASDGYSGEQSFTAILEGSLEQSGSLLKPGIDAASTVETKFNSTPQERLDFEPSSESSLLKESDEAEAPLDSMILTGREQCRACTVKLQPKGVKGWNDASLSLKTAPRADGLNCESLDHMGSDALKGTVGLVEMDATVDIEVPTGSKEFVRVEGDKDDGVHVNGFDQSHPYGSNNDESSESLGPSSIEDGAVELDDPSVKLAVLDATKRTAEHFELKEVCSQALEVHAEGDDVPAEAEKYSSAEYRCSVVEESSAGEKNLRMETVVCEKQEDALATAESHCEMDHCSLVIHERRCELEGMHLTALDVQPEVDDQRAEEGNFDGRRGGHSVVGEAQAEDQVVRQRHRISGDGHAEADNESGVKGTEVVHCEVDEVHIDAREVQDKADALPGQANTPSEKKGTRVVVKAPAQSEILHMDVARVHWQPDDVHPETGDHSEADGRTMAEKARCLGNGVHMAAKKVHAYSDKLQAEADRHSGEEDLVEEEKGKAEGEALDAQGKTDNVPSDEEDERSVLEDDCVRAEEAQTEAEMVHLEAIGGHGKADNVHSQEEDENSVPEDGCIEVEEAHPEAEEVHTETEPGHNDAEEKERVSAQGRCGGNELTYAKVEGIQFVEEPWHNDGNVVHAGAEEVKAGAGDGHSKSLAECAVLTVVTGGSKVFPMEPKYSEGKIEGVLAEGAMGCCDGQRHAKEQQLQSLAFQVQAEAQNVNAEVGEPQAESRDASERAEEIHSGLQRVDWNGRNAEASGTSARDDYEKITVGQGICEKLSPRESCPSPSRLEKHLSGGGRQALSSHSEESHAMRMGQPERSTIENNVSESSVVDGTMHVECALQVPDMQFSEQDPAEGTHMRCTLENRGWGSYTANEEGPFDLPDELDDQKEEDEENGPSRLKDTAYQTSMADVMEESVVSKKRNMNVCCEAVQEGDTGEETCLRVYSKKKRVVVTPTPVEPAGMRIRPRPLDPYQSIPIFWEGRDKEFYEFDGGSFHRWVQQQDESRFKALDSGGASSDAGGSGFTARGGIMGRLPIFIPPFRKLPGDQQKQLRTERRQHLERGVLSPLSCPEAYVRYTKSATRTLGHVLGGSFSSIPSVYDMDNEDEEWLQAFNENHKGAGPDRILLEDTFEQLIELFEREFYRIYHSHTSFAAPARDQPGKSITFGDIVKKSVVEPSQRDHARPTVNRSQAKVSKVQGSSLRHSSQMRSELVQQTNSEVCCICNGGENSALNTMYRCHICLVNVHQSCYGICEKEGDGSDCQVTNSSWCCRKCGAVIGGVALSSISCAICCRSGGAMKATVDPSKWAHVACALYTNETFFVDPEAMEPIDGLSAVESRARKQRERCGLCGAREGSCVRCSTKGCRAPFHISCGVSQGASFELRHTKQLVVGVRSFCPTHAAAMSAANGEDIEYDPSTRCSDAAEVLPAVSTESSDTLEIGLFKNDRSADNELAMPVKQSNGTRDTTAISGGDTSSILFSESIPADLSETDAQELSELLLRRGSAPKVQSHRGPRSLEGLSLCLTPPGLGKLEFGAVCPTPCASSIHLSPDMKVVDEMGKINAADKRDPVMATVRIGSEPIDGKFSGRDLDISLPSPRINGTETETLKADSSCQNLPRIKTLHTTLAPLQVVKTVYSFWQKKRMRSKGPILHELKQLEGARVQGIFNKVVQPSGEDSPVIIHDPQAHSQATRRPRSRSRDPKVLLKILELRQQLEMLRKIAGSVVRREQLKREDQTLLYRSVQQRLLLAGQRARIRLCHWCENTQNLLSCSTCTKAFCFHCFKHRRGYGVKGWIAASRLPKYVCNFCMGCTSKESWPLRGANLIPSTFSQDEGKSSSGGADVFQRLDDWNDGFTVIGQPHLGPKVLSWNTALGNLKPLGSSYGKVPTSLQAMPLLSQGRGKVMCSGTTAGGQSVHTKFALPSSFEKSGAVNRANESRIRSSVFDANSGEKDNIGCTDEKTTKRRVKASEKRGMQANVVRTTKRVKKPVRSSSFVYGSEEEITHLEGNEASVEDAKVVKLSELRKEGATSQCTDIPEVCARGDSAEKIHPLKFGIKYSPTIGKLILRRYGARQQQQ